MKKLFILLLLITCELIKAQDYIPIAQDGANWYEGGSWGYGYEDFMHYAIQGDTSINGVKYFKLFFESVTREIQYPYNVDGSGLGLSLIGLLRDTLGRTYFNSSIIYDFNHVAGDIYYIDSSYYHSGDTIFVDSIDSVFINGNYRKRLLLKSNNVYYKKGWVIEGIGNDCGLFQDCFSCEMYFECSSHLSCYRNTEFCLYDNCNDCSLPTPLSIKDSKKIDTDIFTISKSGDNILLKILDESLHDFTLRIIDFTGRVVFEQQ